MGPPDTNCCRNEFEAGFRSSILVGTGFKGVVTAVLAGRAGGAVAVFDNSAAGVVAVQTVVKNAAASEMRQQCWTVFMRT
jgi:hypothetical protein